MVRWFCSECLVGHRPCLAWIVGHSFVHWGAVRADVRKNGRQIGVDRSVAQIYRIGVRGMQWSRLLQEVRFHVEHDRAPDVVVIHCGGNELGGRYSRELARDVKLDWLRLRHMYPKTVLVWSDMVERERWFAARSVKCLNRTRVKINKEIVRFVLHNGVFGDTTQGLRERCGPVFAGGWHSIECCWYRLMEFEFGRRCGAGSAGMEG